MVGTALSAGDRPIGNTLARTDLKMNDEFNTQAQNNGIWPATVRRSSLYAVLAQVPVGKVVTYGQLADLAGLGRAARWVGRTLSQLPPDTRLPWHRVIAAAGRLSLPAGSASGDEQRGRLRQEGVLVVNNRVDLKRHGWRPH